MVTNGALPTGGGMMWPCGGDTGLGCGVECWGAVPQNKRIKKQGKRARNVVFCSKCARGLKPLDKV